MILKVSKCEEEGLVKSLPKLLALIRTSFVFLLVVPLVFVGGAAEFELAGRDNEADGHWRTGASVHAF